MTPAFPFERRRRCHRRRRTVKRQDLRTGGVPELLIHALRAVARGGEVVESVESTHGEKHVVDGTLLSQTDSSQSRMVRTIWIVDRSLDAPRLVTAYPGKE